MHVCKTRGCSVETTYMDATVTDLARGYKGVQCNGASKLKLFQGLHIDVLDFLIFQSDKLLRILNNGQNKVF